ncbi:hypothetical protein [Sphingorhabdus sp.]|uniref:hypothetical protein n=1 Tax=Sphingorhabdus sp. TaxID=1902408 RepID=UPI00391D4804
MNATARKARSRKRTRGDTSSPVRDSDYNINEKNDRQVEKVKDFGTSLTDAGDEDSDEAKHLGIVPLFRF